MLAGAAVEDVPATGKAILKRLPKDWEAGLRNQAPDAAARSTVYWLPAYLDLSLSSVRDVVNPDTRRQNLLRSDLAIGPKEQLRGCRSNGDSGRREDPSE